MSPTTGDWEAAEARVRGTEQGVEHESDVVVPPVLSVATMSMFSGPPMPVYAMCTAETGMVAPAPGATDRLVYPVPFQYWIVPAAVTAGAAVLTPASAVTESVKPVTRTRYPAHPLGTWAGARPAGSPASVSVPRAREASAWMRP